MSGGDDDDLQTALRKELQWLAEMRKRVPDITLEIPVTFGEAREIITLLEKMRAAEQGGAKT